MLCFPRFAPFLLVLTLLAACSTPADEADFSSPGAGMAQLGKHMEEKGEIGGAIDFYRRALAADPKNLTALRGLAGVLTGWGDKRGAAEVYEKAVAVWPEQPDLRRDYGKLLIALDEPARALRQFEAALSIDSGDTKARSGKGVAFDYLGDHRKAQKEYERVLEDEPGNLAAVNNLAYSYILSKRYDRAIKLLEPVATKPSAAASLRQNLALAYGLSGMELDAERMARMDLPAEKVKENMDYYRRKRAEIALDKAPYAEIGTYATEAMAIAQIHKLKEQMKRTGGDLRPIVLPQVSAPGGTPRFTVRMMGCSKPDDVSRLCATLAKSGLPCVPKGKGSEE